METHVKVLGALNIAFGALGLLGAVLLLLVFGGAVGAVGAASATNGDPHAAIAIPLIGITGLALVTFLVIVSAPGIIIASACSNTVRGHGLPASSWR